MFSLFTTPELLTHMNQNSLQNNEIKVTAAGVYGALGVCTLA